MLDCNLEEFDRFCGDGAEPEEAHEDYGRYKQPGLSMIPFLKRNGIITEAVAAVISAEDADAVYKDYKANQAEEGLAPVIDRGIYKFVKTPNIYS